VAVSPEDVFVFESPVSIYRDWWLRLEWRSMVYWPE